MEDESRADVLLAVGLRVDVHGDDETDGRILVVLSRTVLATVATVVVVVHGPGSVGQYDRIGQ